MGLILYERSHDNEVLKCKNCKLHGDSVKRSSSLLLSTPPQNVPKLNSTLSRGPTQLNTTSIRVPPVLAALCVCWFLLLGRSQFSHRLTLPSSLTCNNLLLLTSETWFFGLPSFSRESHFLLLLRLQLYVRIPFIRKFAIRNVLFWGDGTKKGTKPHKSWLQYRIQIRMMSAMNKALVSNAKEKKCFNVFYRFLVGFFFYYCRTIITVVIY